MTITGLRVGAHLPKQVRIIRKREKRVRRWLIVLVAVAVIALIAGYVTFGGGNMGH
jgi:t-SNARE complex subunit (syntaxin)